MCAPSPLEQVLGAPASRTAEQVEEAVCEVFSHNRIQQRLVKQMKKCTRVRGKTILHDPGEQILEFPEPQVIEQLADVPKIVAGLARSLSLLAPQRMTRPVAKSVGVGEVRPLWFEKYSATSVSESELAEVFR